MGDAFSQGGLGSNWSEPGRLVRVWGRLDGVLGRLGHVLGRPWGAFGTSPRRSQETSKKLLRRIQNLKHTIFVGIYNILEWLSGYYRKCLFVRVISISTLSPI